MSKKRRDCKLLPHIKQPIYGLSADVAQMIPWSISMFNIPELWQRSNGKNVIVAVIDTGCDLHHEDINKNLIDGFNFIEMGSDPIDRNGHGTHVAGTICAINNNKGVVGVSPETKIMPIKALDDSGTGSNTNIGSAIVWAVDHGADIITMSLGSDHPSLTIERALAYAIEKGVVVFCAAGNSGIKHDIQFPAKYKETISIGAVNKNLAICQFSCSGDELDFLAPGEDILSTVPGNNYALMTGTSMAAPFAVGCASLWLSFCRKYTDKNAKLSKIDYINHFKKYAIGLSDSQYAGLKRYEGHGIIRPHL